MRVFIIYRECVWLPDDVSNYMGTGTRYTYMVQCTDWIDAYFWLCRLFHCVPNFVSTEHSSWFCFRISQAALATATAADGGGGGGKQLKKHRSAY